MTSIDRMPRLVGDDYYPEFARTVKYILNNKFICISKDKCSDQEESKWKR